MKSWIRAVWIAMCVVGAVELLGFDAPTTGTEVGFVIGRILGGGLLWGTLLYLAVRFFFSRRRKAGEARE